MGPLRIHVALTLFAVLTLALGTPLPSHDADGILPESLLGELSHLAPKQGMTKADPPFQEMELIQEDAASREDDTPPFTEVQKEETKKEEGTKKEEPKKKEEGKEEEAGEAKKEEETVTKDSDIDVRNLWSFLFIIGFLILVTVLFETAKESIYEYTKGTDDEAMVMTIFSELTVLGFLALVTFLITKLGLDHLSLIIYGHSDVEEDKAMLGEILEQIHMVIFLIMILFIAQAVSMLIFAKFNVVRVAKSESLVVTHYQRKRLVDQFRMAAKPSMAEYIFSHFGWKRSTRVDSEKFLKAWAEGSEKVSDTGVVIVPGDKTIVKERAAGAPCPDPQQCYEDNFLEVEVAQMTYWELNHLVNFMLQRQKFLFDGDGDLDKKPSPKTMLDPGFSFSLYIRKMVASRLQQVVELPASQWLTLFALVAIVLCTSVLFDGCWEFVLWFWVCLGWTLLFAVIAFESYLKHILHELSFDLDENELLDNRSDQRKRELELKREQASALRSSAILEVGDDSPLDGSPQDSPRPASRPALSEDPSHEWITGVPRYYKKYKTLGVDKICDNVFSKGKDYKITKDIQMSTTCVPNCLKSIQEFEKKQARHKIMYNLFLCGKLGYGEGQGMNEVTFHLGFLRFLFLGVATFLSVFFIQIGPAYLWKAYDPASAIFISIVCVLPGFIIDYFYVFLALRQSVLVTSTDAFRSDRQVNGVIRHQKEQRAVLMLKLVTSMSASNQKETEWKQLADGVDVDKKGANRWYGSLHTTAMTERIQREWEDAASAETSSLEIEQLMHIFDLFDLDNSKSLTEDELMKVLDTFGLGTKSGENSDGPLTDTEKMKIQMKKEVTEIAEIHGIDLYLDEKSATDHYNLVLVPENLKKLKETQAKDLALTPEQRRINNMTEDEEQLRAEQAAKVAKRTEKLARVAPKEIAKLQEITRGNFLNWMIVKADPHLIPILPLDQTLSHNRARIYQLLSELNLALNP